MTCGQTAHQYDDAQWALVGILKHTAHSTALGMLSIAHHVLWGHNLSQQYNRGGRGGIAGVRGSVEVQMLQPIASYMHMCACVYAAPPLPPTHTHLDKRKAAVQGSCSSKGSLAAASWSLQENTQQRRFVTALHLHDGSKAV